MKKFLFLILLLAIFANARSQEQLFSVNATENIQKSQAVRNSVIKNTNFIQEKSFSDQVLKRIEPSNLNVKAVSSDVLDGTLIGKGESYRYGNVSWEVTVKADSSEPNKYWLEGLHGYNLPDVYATLSGNTLTFPIPQELGSTDEMKLAFYGLSSDNSTISSGSITATVDVNGDTISFPNQGFGVYVTENVDDDTGFIDAFFAGVVLYTEDALPLEPAYLAPQGTLYYTMSRESYGFPLYWGIAPANTTWTWHNIKQEVGVSYTWDYTDGNGNNPVSVQATNLTIDAGSTDVYIFPTLTATLGNRTGSFTYPAISDEFDIAYIEEGGGTVGATIEEKTVLFHPSNVIPDAGFVGWAFSTDVYVFGTGVNGNGFATDELITLYEKPLAPLYFEGIDVFCTTFSAPGTTEFTLSVVTVDINDRGFPVMKDTVAQSKILASDVFSPGGNWGILEFRNFIAKDEDGFETSVPYLLLEDNFVLIFSGYNKEGVKLCVMSERYDRPDSRNLSFFTYEDEEGKKGMGQWTNVPNTMYFLLYNGGYFDGLSSEKPVSSNNSTQVYTTNDSFELNYTSDFTTASVYNLAGQVVATYDLPETGKFTVSSAALTKGTYLIQFTGKSTETVKVVK